MRQRIEASIEIDAPVETVWATVHDPAVDVEGIDWVREAWWEDEHPPGRGSVYAERAEPGIKATIYRWELTVFEQPPAARSTPTPVVSERTAVRWKMQRDFERMILPNYKRIAERRAAS